ncbi:MAG: DUF202 domain-containing protein [Planctomycetaceae bacterium]|nr:DUF202 domain-containing protein [Planctomycetaceae bacterium]
MSDVPSPPVERPDARTYFAAERTLLAWIRTGLAMMGFGFVVARFGLFLREIAAISDLPARSHFSVSLWIGTGLVLFGVIVTIAAAIKHQETLRRLEQGQPLRFSRWSMGIVVGLLLGLGGMLMTGYLLWEFNR